MKKKKIANDQLLDSIIKKGNKIFFLNEIIYLCDEKKKKEKRKKRLSRNRTLDTCLGRLKVVSCRKDGDRKEVPASRVIEINKLANVFVRFISNLAVKRC